MVSGMRFMTYKPYIHNRRSIRLNGYDYTQTGAYFVTVCMQNHECLFGEITDGQMVLNDTGRIVNDCWNNIPVHFPHVELDEFIIMPNHVHGIFVIVGANVGATHVDVTHIDVMHVGATHASPLQQTSTPCGPKRHSVGAIVGSFKSAVTKRTNEIQNTPGAKLWQRNYYEHIIRDENNMNRIREYIMNNPLKWESDRENPKAVIYDQ